MIFHKCLNHDITAVSVSWVDAMAGINHAQGPVVRPKQRPRSVSKPRIAPVVAPIPKYVAAEHNSECRQRSAHALELLTPVNSAVRQEPANERATSGGTATQPGRSNISQRHLPSTKAIDVCTSTLWMERGGGDSRRARMLAWSRRGPHLPAKACCSWLAVTSPPEDIRTVDFGRLDPEGP